MDNDKENEKDNTPMKNTTLFGIKSLAELSSENKLGRNIPTGCKIMNDFLSGGIQTGILTEIYGEAGTGKTQLSVQIMLEALFDYKNKGLEGKCVYISTLKHLHEVKLETLIQAFLKRHQLSSKLDVRSFIQQYHTLEIKDFEKVIESEIKKTLVSGICIKLIVIDNIASISSEMLENSETRFLFERANFLKQVSTILKTLAVQYDIAIIVINNVISAFSEDYRKSQKVIPSLGPLWTSFVNERFKLSKCPESTKKIPTSQKETSFSSILRSLKVKLSSRLQRKELFYLIDNDGVKGVTANL